jgi:hypothetical protein
LGEMAFGESFGCVENGMELIPTLRLNESN